MRPGFSLMLVLAATASLAGAVYTATGFAPLLSVVVGAAALLAGQVAQSRTP